MSYEHERLVIIRHAPYSSNALREGLDVALVAAALAKRLVYCFLARECWRFSKSRQPVRQDKRQRYRPLICWRCMISTSC